MANLDGSVTDALERLYSDLGRGGGGLIVAGEIPVGILDHEGRVEMMRRYGDEGAPAIGRFLPRLPPTAQPQ